MHDKFYVIHKINNPKGMVMGDGGFTEGMLFVIFLLFGDAIPPHFEPWMADKRGKRLWKDKARIRTRVNIGSAFQCQTCTQVSAVQVQVKSQVFKAESKSHLKSLFYLLATVLSASC